MIVTQVTGLVQAPDRSSTAIVDGILLRQVSPGDAKWDDHRAETDKIRELYQGTYLDALAGRLSECSGYLEFAWDIDQDGKPKIKLRTARFCRVRTCPVCQWRKSLMWRAKAFKTFPKVVEAYPKHRWLFLTLTVRNCQVQDLKATLAKMGKAWGRLTARKQWPADGWIRSVEVTRGEGDTVHPHYHCLLMVKPSYFSHGYINQETWTNLWQESLRIDYKPIVDIRPIKAKRDGQPDMLSAILETLKYTVKPSDLLGQATEQDREFLLELTFQLHKTRTVATGGILKQYLKELEEEPSDLIHCDENGETDSEGIASIGFQWNEKIKYYKLTD